MGRCYDYPCIESLSVKKIKCLIKATDLKACTIWCKIKLQVSIVRGEI